MLFPDCRNDDYYNQDFLDQNDHEFINGFDWCMQMAVDNFFDNIEDYLESDKLSSFLNKKVPENLKDKYEMEFTLPVSEPRENETRTIKTFGDYLRFKLLEYIESERDELITSMIDHMDEKVYKARRNKVLKDNAKQDNPKEYYDSRKFMFTSEKVSDGPEK